MILSRVTGTVVATQREPGLAAHKLLVVQPLALDGTVRAGAAEQVALDPGLDAGVGDAVLIAKEGAVVADLLDAGTPAGPPTPANVVIVAVVDTWEAR